MKRPEVSVIGCGPAGLMAAEVLARGGCAVTIRDRMAAPARKFLLAGRGGLNLTHSEPLEKFLGRYDEGRGFLEPAIRAFPPSSLMEWVKGLGIETFVGSSGRVFPVGMKASPLLRAWLSRLDGLGVKLKLKSRWDGFDGTPTILAMGGASYPHLGSDAAWVPILEARGIAVTKLEPANCRFLADWPPVFAERFKGQPLKNLALTYDGMRVRGEVMISADGIEGGGIYALSKIMRQRPGLPLMIDLRPELSHEALAVKLSRPRGKESLSNFLRKAAGLNPLAIGLLRETGTEPDAAGIKHVPLHLKGPAGIARAISTAGGIAREELDGHFQLRKLPGVFACGEMLDWEAPTGGYLLQASLATGAWAARGMLAALQLQAAASSPQSGVITPP